MRISPPQRHPYTHASAAGFLALGLAGLGAVGGAAADPQERPMLGYDDTPLLPGSAWRVHDSKRPRPAVVVPPPLTPAPPPSDAIVLFDGSDLHAWEGHEGPAGWKLVEGAMEVDGSGDISSVEAFGDVQLHLEWATPAEVRGDSQGRGNSGVFLMGRYEVQVLDSYRNDSYADGQAGALYGQAPPLANACRPPGEWQSYDIVFRAPRFDDGVLLEPARVTVIHNGICVQAAQEFLGGTTHRALPTYSAHEERAPIRLQDHGNPVRYRNVWARHLEIE